MPLALFGQQSDARKASRLVSVRTAVFYPALTYPSCLAPHCTGATALTHACAAQIGMEKFRRADVDGSLEDFNQALQLDPQLRPYLWQRGLSLFYAGLRPLALIY